MDAQEQNGTSPAARRGGGGANILRTPSGYIRRRVTRAPTDQPSPLQSQQHGHEQQPTKKKVLKKREQEHQQPSNTRSILRHEQAQAERLQRVNYRRGVHHNIESQRSLIDTYRVKEFDKLQSQLDKTYGDQIAQIEEEILWEQAGALYEKEVEQKASPSMVGDANGLEQSRTLTRALQQSLSNLHVQQQQYHQMQQERQHAYGGGLVDDGEAEACGSGASST